LKLLLQLDLTPIVESILKGEFPDNDLTVDQQVALVNQAAHDLVALGGVDDPEAIMEQVNNLALWLGGLHADIQVYAWQLIRRVKHIGVLADDKTAVRLRPLEEKIFQDTPYEAESFEDLNHYAWPKTFLDGSTFEDRLEAVFKQQLQDDPPEIVSPDMILNGIGHDTVLNFSDAYAQTSACCHTLSESKDYKPEKGKLANMRYHERMDNFLGWLANQEPEIAIFGLRTILVIFRLLVDPSKLTNWEKFSDYADLLPK